MTKENFDYSEFVRGLFNHPETFNKKYLNSLHAAVGLAGESGEFLDNIKKATWQGHKLDTDKLEKELGDIRFYFQAACNELNTTEDKVRNGNIDKLLDRYPKGEFKVERSINRNERV